MPHLNVSLCICHSFTSEQLGFWPWGLSQREDLLSARMRRYSPAALPAPLCWWHLSLFNPTDSCTYCAYIPANHQYSTSPGSHTEIHQGLAVSFFQIIAGHIWNAVLKRLNDIHHDGVMFSSLPSHILGAFKCYVWCSAVQIHVWPKECRPQRRDPDTGMKYLLVGFKRETTGYNFSLKEVFLFTKKNLSLYRDFWKHILSKYECKLCVMCIGLLWVQCSII